MKSGDDGVLFRPTNVRSPSDIVIGPHQLAWLTSADVGNVEDIECRIDVPNAYMMYVYQSVEMRRLYRRYGNLLVVLDAVYRAGRYPLPLFFLLVRTNVNCQVAAVFVVQRETRQSLVDALQVIRTWNPDVNPRFAVCDIAEDEISALEETFSGCVAHYMSSL